MELEVYNGLPGEVVLVSSGDYELVKNYRWGILRQNRDEYTQKYVRAVTGYDRNNMYRAKYVYLHRLLTNCAKGKEVDHLNGNGLDNRRDNIRVCTRAQNAQNRRKRN